MSPLDAPLKDLKKQHTYKAKSYDYVIFPSWLYHEKNQMVKMNELLLV